MEKMIPWFDLSAYGASLKIIPKNSMRDRNVAVLVVSDSQRAFAQLKSDAEAAGLDAEGAIVSTRFQDAAAGLGFTPFVRRLKYLDSGEEVTTNEAMNVKKSEFSLSELRHLFPSLTQAAVVPTPLSAIRYADAVSASPHASKWQDFASAAAAHETSHVWVADTDLETPPYAIADSLIAVRDDALRQGMVSLNRISLHTLASEDLLRGNAFVRYFYSKDEAVSAGIDPERVIEASFPYALPMLGSKDGALAIRDFRVARHGILAEDPEYAIPLLLRQFPRVTRSLERDLNEYRDRAEAAVLAAASGSLAPELVQHARDEIQGLCFKAVELWPQANVRSDGAKAAQVLYSKDGNAKSLRDHLQALDVLHKPDRGLSRVAVASDFSLQPMGLLTEAELSAMSDLILPVAVNRDEVRAKALADGLQAMVDQDKGLREAAILAKSRAELEATKSKVAKQAEASAKLTIDDAGVKIGGARKDYAKRAMVVSELSGMTALEREQLVVKGNVWAPLDYRAMREEGRSPQFALYMKQVKDSINPKPVKSSFSEFSDDEVQRHYIEAVSMVRDAVMPCKTASELNEALFSLYFRCQSEDVPERGVPVEQPVGYRSVFDASFPAHMALGRDFCNLIARAADYTSYDPNTGARLLDKKVIYSAFMPGDIGRAIQKKMRDEKYDYVDGEYKFVPVSADEHWRVLIKPSKVKSDLEVDEEQKKRDLDRHLHRVHLAHVTREGEDWRQGKNIMPEDLMEHFGFRAVEFGKWLPQDERQEVLNHAFDSFCDLANVLKIPPKDVAFDGKLAIAFGSRGTGGAKAALAHFEPARFVINLTRMSGAGSLAHEWFHALDFHLGGHKGYMSESGPLANEALKEPRLDLLKAIKIRVNPIDLAVKERTDKYKKHIDYAVSWVRYEYRDTLVSTLGSEEARAESEKFVDHLKGLATDWAATVKAKIDSDLDQGVELGECLRVVDRMCVDFRESFVETAMAPFKRLKKQNTDQLSMNTSTFSFALQRACILDVAERRGLSEHPVIIELRGPADTSFLRNAEALDEMRSKPYWATTLEMFARAGECYVFDRLKDVSSHCDYLVHGVEETTYESSEHGNPYPQKEEREAINAAFDSLISVYRASLVRDRDLAIEDVEPSPMM